MQARSDPPRHELADIDAAALVAARAADHALAVAREMEAARWVRYLERLPDRLRDDPLKELRATVRAARAAYGPRDSIRDTLPELVTEPLLVAIDRLQKVIARYDTHH